MHIAGIRVHECVCVRARVYMCLHAHVCFFRQRTGVNVDVFFPSAGITATHYATRFLLCIVRIQLRASCTLQPESIIQLSSSSLPPKCFITVLMMFHSFPPQALCLNPEEDIHQGFQELLSNLNKPSRKYSLRTANRLFAENTCKILPVSSVSRMISTVFKILVDVDARRRTLENLRKLRIKF